MMDLAPLFITPGMALIGYGLGGLIGTWRERERCRRLADKVMLKFQKGKSSPMVDPASYGLSHFVLLYTLINEGKDADDIPKGPVAPLRVCPLPPKPRNTTP